MKDTGDTLFVIISAVFILIWFGVLLYLLSKNNR